MRDSLMVKDNFAEFPMEARQSALASGFGTWSPNQGIVGSSKYDGMNFNGLHSVMLRALSHALGGRPIFPNSMFFRVTTPDTERAYIHSDRSEGDWTCVAYLSEHDVKSGTGFYRHRKTGLLEMPTFSEMELRDMPGEKRAAFDELKRDMIEGGDDEWELMDFVRGQFNRAVIFYAPLFHARYPLHGIGFGEPEDARMIWACHFYI